jgi:hypothetical protein
MALPMPVTLPVMRMTLFSRHERIEVVRAAEDGLVWMQIKIPAAGGDGVVKAARLHEIFLREDVLAEDAAALTHADPWIGFDEIRISKGGHVLLPRTEHRVRIGAALHLRPREISGVGGVRRNADTVDVNLRVVIEEHHAGAIEVRQFASLLRSLQRRFAGLAEFRHRFHVADAEVERERLHLGVLLEGRASPRRHIGIAGAVDDDFGLHGDESVLVRERHGLHAVAAAVRIADEAVEKHAEVRLLLFKQAVEQQLELEGVREGRVVFLDRLRIRRTHARLRQHLQRDTAHDDALRVDVCDAVKVRQPHARDDPAGKRRLFHQQRLGSRPRSSEGRRAARATSAADEHVSFDDALRHGAKHNESCLVFTTTKCV